MTRDTQPVSRRPVLPRLIYQAFAYIEHDCTDHGSRPMAAPRPGRQSGASQKDGWLRTRPSGAAGKPHQPLPIVLARGYPDAESDTRRTLTTRNGYGLRLWIPTSAAQQSRT